MSIQSTLNQEAIEMLPIISAIIKGSDAFEANQIRCSALKACMNSSKSISEMNEDELRQFQLDYLPHYEDMGWFSLSQSMRIVGCSIADFCDDQSTVEVEVEDILGEKETFYVQTVDFQYRRDLGCWLTTSGSDGDISYDDYPLFHFDLIIKSAEKHIKSLHEVKNVKANICTITNPDGSCNVVAENANFINSATSSYQTQYDKDYGTFDSESDALEFIKLVFNENGNYHNPAHCESLEEIIELCSALDGLAERHELASGSYYDASNLPNFGREPEVTDEIFSWDDSRLLLYGTTLENKGWHLVERCKICGEATFHCDHKDD